MTFNQPIKASIKPKGVNVLQYTISVVSLMNSLMGNSFQAFTTQLSLIQPMYQVSGPYICSSGHPQTCSNILVYFSQSVKLSSAITASMSTGPILEEHLAVYAVLHEAALGR